MLLTTRLAQNIVHATVDAVAAETYGGNIVAEVEHVRTSTRGKHAGKHTYRVKLNARDSRAEGARRSWSGRRGPWTCWHAFRDVFAAWLLADPDAVIRTGVATYDGARGFLDTFPATGMHNIGSLAEPLCMADACECELDAEDRDDVTAGPGRDLRYNLRDYVAELERAAGLPRGYAERVRAYGA